MSNHYQVELEQQPIELYKMLKIANLVGGGGEAKVMISDGYVLLNGEVETQKRKKIYSGDIIEFNGDLVEMICHNEPEVVLPRVKDKNKPSQKLQGAKNSRSNNKFKNSKATHSNKSPKPKNNKKINQMSQVT